MAVVSEDRTRSEERLDQMLRGSLAPDEETVWRTVSGALSSGGPLGAGRRTPAWPLAAVILVALALAGFVLLQLVKTKPAESRGHSGRPRLERITLTNASGEVELLVPPGRPGPEPPQAAKPESRPACNSLYNRGGVVVLCLCNGAPQYWIAGGRP